MSQSRQLDTQSFPAGGLDRDSAIALIAASGDIALVVDGKGIIRDVSATEGSEPASEDTSKWVGQQWLETVTVESRGKVEALIRDVAATGVSRRRQVNHPMASGIDMPIAYTAVRLNDSQGGLVAVGRDMRMIASLQQRLVETQQALERDYWRLRHVETRYRLLFQVSSEAILVVDSSNRRIVDANDAAGRLFDRSTDKLVGRTFPIGIDPESEPALEQALATARTAGRSGNVSARLAGGAGGSTAVEVSVSCFRQDAVSLFLVRFSATGLSQGRGADLGAEIKELLANTPDGFVVTDLEGRIMSANQAFLDQAQLSGEQQAHGRPLSDWIGRPGADLGVFLATLRKHGAVRIMATALRGEQGQTAEVEISAAAAPSSETQCIGFIIRDVGRRLVHGPRGARDLTAAVEQLTSLVGRVALRDLLRDTSDLVERHFIEAALELTSDNRTAAAEVLGLSRQSLYVKMRRHQLAAGVEAEDRQVG